MSIEEPTTAEAAVVGHYATAAVEPQSVEPGGIYSVVVPEGGEHMLLDLTAQRDAREAHPQRKKGTVSAFDGEAFALLVKDIGPSDGVTRIYGDPKNLSLTAVLNDDVGDGGVPGWRDHRICFTVQRTKAWQTWLDGQGAKEQVAFAEHIENQRADIVRPSAADMLEIAQTIEATIAAQFKSGARLKDGARQLTYHEVIEGKAGREGQLEIPDTIGLVLVLFEGGEPTEVEARIRYRIEAGRLKIGYVIPDADDHERSAFDGICDRVEAALEQPIILGRPA